MPLIDALLLDPAPLELWITARTDGQKGCGTTINDPYNGSTTALFDGIMKSLGSLGSANILVHLGPGIFTTTGYKDSSPSVGWQIQPGMRIVGSGVGVTTLKQEASGSGRFYAIGHDLAGAAPCDLCEVSDMTIDCNLPDSDSLACGAVRLMGNHVRIRNVRAINWGAHYSGPTCFVFAAISGDRSDGSLVPVEPIDVGIEGCIANEPSIYNAGRTNVFHVGGSSDAASIPEAFGKVPFIRNCFVDGRVPGDSPPDPLEAEIRALSMNWCKGGVVQGNQIHNVQIGGPHIENATCRDLIVRGNTYKNVKRGPWWKLRGLITIGAILDIARDGNTATVTVGSPHQMVVGDRIEITVSSPTGFDGVYVITAVPSLTTFKIAVTTSQSSATITLKKLFGLSNLLVENNVLELATGDDGEIAIHIDDGKADNDTTHDTPDYDCLDAIIRENKIGYVNGQFAGGYTGRGIKVSGVKDVIVQENALELAPDDAIQDFRCGKVRYLDNRNLPVPALDGLVPEADRFQPELEVPSEEAFAFANLDK